MTPAVRSPLLRYAFVLLAVGTALLARLLGDPLLDDHVPFVTFYVAVAAVAWYGGVGPTLLAMALGYLAADYFFIPPRYSLGITLLHHQVELGGYLFVGLAIALFSEAFRVAQRRAEAHAQEAQQSHEELQRQMVQRQRLEDEVNQQALELADAGRRKDEFLALLAHELRNPLAAIRGAVQVLHGHHLERPETRQAAGIIDRQAGHMARLVEDLLDMARISRGQVGLRKQPIELAEVVSRGVEASRPLIKAQRHELDVSLPPGPVWLDADPIRLGQVVANLLTNAAKYTPPGGRISLTGTQEPGEVLLRVRDTGVGIPPAMLVRVFDLFRRLDRPLDGSEGGLGIGLGLVRNLVEMHGGQVEAFSEGLGQGSEFVVRLPVRSVPPPARERGPARPAGVPRRPLRVLLVDDHADAAEMLAELLRLAGHEIRTARDGDAALAAARAFQPDVVLLDLDLPGRDGFEMARSLRAEPDAGRVVLVALSVHGSDEARRRSLQAGFDQHLAKPVDPDALQELLAEIEPVAADCAEQ